jgi:hypothetical protein
MRSGDGTNWNVSSVGTVADLFKLRFGGGQFVAVGRGGAILTSSNGATWASQISGTTNDLIGITYGAEKFVAVGFAGKVLTSGDGEHWITQNSITNTVLTDVTYGSGVFVATALGLASGIYTSSDGGTWLRQAIGPLEGITFNDGIFIAVGNAKLILRSTNATDWVTQNAGAGGGNLYQVTHGGGLFVTSGFPGTFIRTSPDGVTWSNQPSGTGASISGFAFGNGTFVAASDAGVILTSTNGLTWTRHSTQATRRLLGVAYGQSSFVLAGYGGTILQSDDTSVPVLTGQSKLGGFQLALTGEIGRAYRIQATTNLLGPHWGDVFSLTNETWTEQRLDETATNLVQRFYRAVTP